MAATEFGIEDLIPHRGRMRLVERIVALDDDEAVTAARVRPAWPLATETGVGALVLVELAAQTAGLLLSRRERLRGTDLTGAAGWLVGIREARLLVDELPLGSEIRTRVAVAFTFETYTQVRALATVDSRPAGDILLQVYWSPGD